MQPVCDCLSARELQLRTFLAALWIGLESCVLHGYQPQEGQRAAPMYALTDMSSIEVSWKEMLWLLGSWTAIRMCSSCDDLEAC